VRGGLSAARDAFTFPPVLLRVHRVLRMLILMRAARRARATATRPCARADADAGAETCRTGRRGGRIVREHHHCVPALSARGHGERDRDREGRLCGCWRGRQRREGGEGEGRVGGEREWMVDDGHRIRRRTARRGVLLRLKGRGGRTCCLRFRTAGRVRRGCWGGG
jgi:hypothetical protein